MNVHAVLLNHCIYYARFEKPGHAPRIPYALAHELRASMTNFNLPKAQMRRPTSGCKESTQNE